MPEIAVCSPSLSAKETGEGPALQGCHCSDYVFYMLLFVCVSVCAFNCMHAHVCVTVYLLSHRLAYVCVCVQTCIVKGQGMWAE